MSLIGSLEDLGLGDILQIISLSQKSGVLVIRSEEGEGRIVFLDGLVRGAVVKGGPTDLRSVLVSGGFVGEDEFAECERRAVESGQPVTQVVAQRTSISSERIDSLQREIVEAAVARMFRWGVGEFSFDVREEPDPEDPPVFVPTGINAQYLAMECSRLGDEAGRAREETADEAEDGPELSAHEMFGVTPPDAPDDPNQRTVETIAASTLASADPFAAADEAPDATADHGAGELVAELLPADALAADGVPLAALEPLEPLEPQEGWVDAPTPPRADPDAPRKPPLVVIDPDLPALEWVKEAVGDAHSAVHIFQRCDLGLNRIRQYLVRGTNPLVLVSPSTPGDPLTGIPDSRDFVRRLKTQAPRMPVLWLDATDGEPTAGVGPGDGRVLRPAPYQLRNAGAAHQREELARQLVEKLDAAVERPPDEPVAGDAISPAALRRLKEATAALREASSRGEVLPLVIRFAAERFSRVAMFAVLDGVVMGMAQSGLPRAGGPDDAGLRQIRLEPSDCERVLQVLDTRAAQRGHPEGEGDRALAMALGDRVPAESYLAPIESAGQVVALLYADNLPEDRPLPETSALEVVLHHAGLALDRAALERALAQAEGEVREPAKSLQGDASGTRRAAGSPPGASRKPSADR